MINLIEQIAEICWYSDIKNNGKWDKQPTYIKNVYLKKAEVLKNNLSYLKGEK